MKKIFSIIISIAIIFSINLNAFASGGFNTGNKVGESHSIDVTAKTESAILVPDSYSVDITWENMTFTYIENGTKIWNASTHTYTTNTEGSWDKNEAKINVVNHSNVPVTAIVEYTPITETGVLGVISNGSKTLAAGVENKPDEADSLMAILNVSGTPTNNVTTGNKIGFVKVTIGQ